MVWTSPSGICQKPIYHNMYIISRIKLDCEWYEPTCANYTFHICGNFQILQSFKNEHYLFFLFLCQDLVYESGSLSYSMTFGAIIISIINIALAIKCSDVASLHFNSLLALAVFMEKLACLLLQTLLMFELRERV